MLEYDVIYQNVCQFIQRVGYGGEFLFLVRRALQSFFPRKQMRMGMKIAIGWNDDFKRLAEQMPDPVLLAPILADS